VVTRQVDGDGEATTVTVLASTGNALMVMYEVSVLILTAGVIAAMMSTCVAFSKTGVIETKAERVKAETPTDVFATGPRGGQQCASS
jgi:hypothetical protein